MVEQQETPQEPGQPPAPPLTPPSVPKVELPTPGKALPIPDNFRLPFHGKMATPTAVPSATERRYNVNRLQQRRRRRGFLTGLLAGQLLIIGMDLGGVWFLHTHPNVKLQAPIGVPAVVFLGMAIGAAVMIAALALIFLVLALRAVFGKRDTGLFTALFRGVARLFATGVVMAVCMAVILGTAWFMIPGAEWKPTVDFARDQGKQAAHATASRVRSMLHLAPRQP